MSPAPSQLVQDTLVAVTALSEGMFWRANVGAARTPSGGFVSFNLKGTPDILGCYRGRGVGLECKSGKGALKPDQKLWRKNWSRAGGIYVEVRCPEDALRALEAVQ